MVTKVRKVVLFITGFMIAVSSAAVISKAIKNAKVKTATFTIGENLIAIGHGQIETSV